VKAIKKNTEQGNITLLLTLTVAVIGGVVLYFLNKNKDTPVIKTIPNENAIVANTNPYISDVAVNQLVSDVPDEYKCKPVPESPTYCHATHLVDWGSYSFNYPDVFKLKGIGAFGTNVALVDKVDDTIQKFTLYIEYYDQDKNKNLKVADYDKFLSLGPAGPSVIWTGLLRDSEKLISKKVVKLNGDMDKNKQALEMLVETPNGLVKYYVFDVNVKDKKHMFILRFISNWQQKDIDALLASFNISVN